MRDDNADERETKRERERERERERDELLSIPSAVPSCEFLVADPRNAEIHLLLERFVGRTVPRTDN